MVQSAPHVNEANEKLEGAEVMLEEAAWKLIEIRDLLTARRTSGKQKPGWDRLAGK